MSIPSLFRHQIGTRIVVAAGCLTMLIGCGPPDPPVAPVRGIVTYKGKPVSMGTVLFIPQFSGQYARGNIQPDGTYTLTTFKDGDGALVGFHKIIVNAVDASNLEAAPIPIVPSEYFSEQTSGLSATVIADQENIVDLALVAKPKSKR